MNILRFEKLKLIAQLPKSYTASIVGLSFLCALWSSSTLFPIYEAHAKLSVGPDINTQKERLFSRSVLLQTLYALQTQKQVPKKVSLPELKSRLFADPVPHTQILNLAFRYPESGTAATILNTIAVTFINHDKFVQQQLKFQRKSSLEKQLLAQQKMLQKAENEIAKLKKARASNLVLIKLAKKAEHIAQTYDATLTFYQKTISNQEPLSPILLVESATPPQAQIHPYHKLVFSLTFLGLNLLGLSGLWIWKGPKAELFEPSVRPPLPPSLPTESKRETTLEASPKITLESAPAITPLEPISLPPIEPPTESPKETVLITTPKLDNPLETTLNALLPPSVRHTPRLSLLVIDTCSSQNSQTLVSKWAIEKSSLHQKSALITFHHSRFWKSYFNRNTPPQTLTQYMENAPIQNIAQDTSYPNCYWIPADEFSFINISTAKLNFLNRRLRLHYDTLIYYTTAASLTSNTFHLYEGLADGWIILHNTPLHLPDEKAYPIWGSIQIP